MLRMLARLVGVICAFCATGALALGLGDITVQSKLNQRFSATIPVLGATPNQLDSLIVKLAGQDAFNNAGIERADYLGSLKFEVQSGAGGARVVVTSDQLAREPFLNFIVEADTPDGKIMHEYTVLLDPPTLAESQQPPAAAPAPAPAPVQAYAPPPPAAPDSSAPAYEPAAKPMAPVVPSPRVHPGRKPVPAPAPVAAAPVESAAAASGASTYGPVAPQETLWSIATKLRPGLQVSMDQVLLAIYRANPGSFDRGSFNGLIKGQTLQVPSLGDMRQTPPAEAKVLVDNWRHGARPGGNTAAAETAPVKKNKAEPRPAPVAAEPIPAPAPEKPKPAPKPAAPQSPAAAVIAPSAPEAPHATVVDTQPQPAPSTPAAAVPPATPPAPAPAAEAPKPAPVETPAASPPPAAAVPPSTPAPPAAPAKKPSPPLAPPPGLFEDSSTQMGLMAALVVLIGAIGWVIFRRRKPAVPDFTAPTPAPKITLGPLKPKAPAVPPPLPPKPMSLGDTTAIPEQHLEPADPLAPPSLLPAAAPELPPEPRFLDTAQLQAPANVNLDRSIPPQPVGKGDVDFDLTSQLEAQTVSINMDANDPASEADFHLAYGLYDEAASLLKQALQKDPQRSDLRLKLAETYFAAGKPMDFQETAEALHGQLSPADWQKVAIMGRQLCPESGLFKTADTAEPAVDLSLGESIGPVLAAVPAPTRPARKDPNVIDFDLDSELLKATPGAAKPAAGEPAKSDFDLSHFDLSAEPHPPAGEAIEFNLDELDLSKPAGSIASGDEIGTKLDLARVYADMGDNEAARGLLHEVLSTGNDSQKGEAEALIKRLSA